MPFGLDRYERDGSHPYNFISLVYYTLYIIHKHSIIILIKYFHAICIYYITLKPCIVHFKKKIATRAHMANMSLFFLCLGSSVTTRIIRIKQQTVNFILFHFATKGKCFHVQRNFVFSLFMN